ncbi:hypothetical protein HBN50_08970 [Halobacteriovorax sp. GB3]|uniref:hypothetical protein n=1 Tax=Halobacteriovorax sp. GB3 TaxID=2719615 RepID=UPI00235E51B3|nr:hypothetical protein [Halobacteriovorax sp. GB3]MDD0853228.1 hypothetical protein [Halobacteriovorax sp. GB3]
MEDREIYQLGNLVSESSHELTTNLSELAKSPSTLSKAFETFQKVDSLALCSLRKNLSKVHELSLDIEKTLSRGGRIILCGCGATGRLALLLEHLFKKYYQAHITSFMCGGDYALVQSIEAFEDHPEYGLRQLHELRPKEIDLFIGITEGGETPFVIGATEEAASLCSVSYFLYCNPDDQLMQIKRSRSVLENESIKKVNLTCGPMALSGSTRLQATSVQLIFCALSLECALGLHRDSLESRFESLVKEHELLDYRHLVPFTLWESDIYLNNGAVDYFCDERDYLNILTDTTERAPTFNLRPFERKQDSFNSLVYCKINRAYSRSEFFRAILSRSERPLDWNELEGRYSRKALFSFLLDNKKREKSLRVDFPYSENKIMIYFQDIEIDISFSQSSHWMRTLFLKMLMNAHSTILMGRLGRYEGNMMMWVKPSNGKLKDRAIRYAQFLLARDEKSYQDLSYDQLYELLEEELKEMNDKESIVMRLLERARPSR